MDTYSQRENYAGGYLALLERLEMLCRQLDSLEDRVADLEDFVFGNEISEERWQKFAEMLCGVKNGTERRL